MNNASGRDRMPPAAAAAGSLATSPGNATPAIAVAGGYLRTRKSLRAWLAHEFPGARIVEAAGADDVRRVVGAENIAVALVDIDLPGMRGIELLRLLRQLAPAAAPIAVTAYHAESYRDYAIGAGAVACLSPHATDDSLMNTVARLLSAAKPVTAPAEVPESVAQGHEVTQ
jgi:DNA-binding NarL/FixJ family response regulator